MNHQILAIILAFIGSSLLNLAQALQKIGMDTPAEQKIRKWGIWVLGTLIMTGAPLILQYATSLSGASLVGAMSGSGLAVLALFSHFVMKEKIGAGELAGVAVILAASVLIGAFSGGKAMESTINLPSLWVFLGAVCVFYGLLATVALKTNRLAGIALGGFAGAVGGFVTLFQKVTMTNPTGASTIFINPFFYIWIGISLVSFFILQLSYKKDKAIRIVPAFSANYILMPILGGVICFNESLNPFQWAGVALIFCGVLLITMKLKGKAVSEG